jgi:hypothetical protein
VQVLLPLLPYLLPSSLLFSSSHYPSSHHDHPLLEVKHNSFILVQTITSLVFGDAVQNFENIEQFENKCKTLSKGTLFYKDGRSILGNSTFRRKDPEGCKKEDLKKIVELTDKYVDKLAEGRRVLDFPFLFPIPPTRLHSFL